MFSYIFGKINQILDVKNTLKSNDNFSKNTVIGVLDIYGFEIFDNNGYVFEIIKFLDAIKTLG